MSDSIREESAQIEYLRAVEDCFAVHKEFPHGLSPKDMYLARKWWTEGIPLAAVQAGIAEVAGRLKGETGDTEPLSLNYCRHAVRRHARALKLAHAGSSQSFTSPPEENRASVYMEKTRERARALEKIYPAVAEKLEEFCRQLEENLLAGNPSIDILLFDMESSLLQAVLGALPADTRREILDGAENRARKSGATDPESVERTRRALVDRLTRELLGLPEAD